MTKRAVPLALMVFLMTRPVSAELRRVDIKTLGMD